MRSYVPGERKRETTGLRPNVATSARSGGRGLLLGRLRSLVAELIRLRAAAQLLEARCDLRGVAVIGPSVVVSGPQPSSLNDPRGAPSAHHPNRVSERCTSHHLHRVIPWVGRDLGSAA